MTTKVSRVGKCLVQKLTNVGINSLLEMEGNLSVHFSKGSDSLAASCMDDSQQVAFVA